MPIIGVQLKPGNTGANVRELHDQLQSVGAVLAPSEQTAKNFGPSTSAAVSAFREQYGLPPGDNVDLATGRLMHVASTFAGGSGRSVMRTAVRDAAQASAANSSQPQELYWLARYAVLAGDYQLAQSIAQLVPNHADIVGTIDPILALPDEQTLPPELAYPENFYTYRRNIYSFAVLDEMQHEIMAVGEPPRDASQARGDDQTFDATRGQVLIDVAVSWLEGLRQWHLGNDALNHRSYAAAQAAYDACQAATCDYFAKYYEIDLGNGKLPERLTNLIKHLAQNKESWSFLWSRIIWRRGLLSLEELRAWDFPKPPARLRIRREFNPPPPFEGTLPPRPDYGLGFIQHYLRSLEFEGPERTARRQHGLEAPLITIAFVLVPLARAEANRARRQFDAAIRDLRWVINSVVVGRLGPTPAQPGFRNVFARLACEFIELPFARLLLAETLLDKADAEHKAMTPAATPPAPDVSEFQNLKAAQTCLAIKDLFKNDGVYVSSVETAATRLTGEIQERLAEKDTSSERFQLLGKDILLPHIVSAGKTLPGLDRTRRTHERLLKFTPPGGQTVLRETNPRVYAALLTATARLEQLKAGFNYLGYLDSYVPPWRFQFLLERARYFAEHAKNAQRDYLNFLSNAEREDLQELSASQNVEMEKSNIRIETSRVDQVTLEVAASSESAQLANTSAENAGKRLVEYKEFDRNMDEKESDSFWGSVISVAAVVGITALTGPGGLAGAAVIGLATAKGAADLSNINIEGSKANQQRELEKKNLERAEQEARQAEQVSQAQLRAAQAGLIVAGLQRQAALLRHEFALQNLQFLRNRVLSVEQWYRLVAAIRSVSETYLRYSVELAFLAEQAYEFEADKRINVIRFDYDLSEVGDFLAADFLLKDLDTLEQDLIVTQKQRQQEVRYVLSMAREFPEALQEIRVNGKAMFSLRLEQLEKRFPGLYNLRIGAVDVLPIALMDSTRFSMELTHLGTSQVRLKAQPDTPPGTPSDSPLNTNDLPIPTGEWLAELQETWPIKLRVTGQETVVFSGLSRQDASAVFAFATTSQRHAFESLGAAAAWQVDFTARDNQVVPGTLADLLITLTLSGYHDPELRKEIDSAPRTTSAATRFLSGQTTFPDALYEFNRSGRMAWNVTRDLLTLTETLGAVRNIAILLLPTPGRTNYFCNVMSQCQVQVRITSTGDLLVLSEIPEVTFTLGGAANPLSLTAQATLAPGATISWDFGDGSARQSGSDQQHTYSKPGRFTVSLRVVRNGRLSEFQGDVVVSRSHAEGLKPPVTAFPTLTRDETSTNIPAGLTRVVGETNVATDDPVIANWRVGNQGGFKGNRATFDLQPGDHTLFFAAVRPLKARAYSTQRHLTEPVLDFSGLSLSSNRRFDLNGTETTGAGANPPANLVAKHLFAQGALSPVDEWTIELPLSDNPFLRSVSATDVEQYGLAEIQDVVLALEYETTPGSS